MKTKKFDTVSFWLVPWFAGYLYTLGIWNNILLSQPTDISLIDFLKGLSSFIMLLPFWPLVLALLQQK